MRKSDPNLLRSCVATRRLVLLTAGEDDYLVTTRRMKFITR